MFRRSLRFLQWPAVNRQSGWLSQAVAVPAAATVAPVAAAPLPPQGSGGSVKEVAGATTSFERRASHFKNRWRGKGLYAFAREDAQRFLDAEVPKAELGAWMEEGINAIALSQLLGFFEIQPEASLASLMMNKLIRDAENTSATIQHRLWAALALIRLRPEENYERIFSVVTSVMPELQRTSARIAGSDRVRHDNSSSGTGSMDCGPASSLRPEVDLHFELLSVCAKVLQRCGKRTPPALNEQLAQAVLLPLRAIPTMALPPMQSELLRLYAWMVRAERPEANQLLYILVEYTGEFRRTDFCTLILSCARHHHQLMPLPVELIHRLARVSFQYRSSFNGRDGAAILGALAKLLVALVPDGNNVKVEDVVRVQDSLNALLEEMQHRVLRLLDPTDTLFWTNAEDMSTCVFAYELGGHTRYHRVFSAYAAYVQQGVQTFEPPQLALATGILRRAQLLTPKLAARLSERIEVVLGELRLAELSHICATYAVLPGPRPSWWEEARAVAVRLAQQSASGVVCMNLAIAFPDQADFAETVDYAQIASKQLVDLLPITLESAQFGEAVVATLCQRLATPGERFAPDELRLLMACGRPQLMQAAHEYLGQAFAQAEWSTDTLYSLPLVIDAYHPEKNLQLFGSAKALAASKAASVGPEQFVSLSDLLLTTFGDSDTGIRDFVRAGGADLLKERSVSHSTVVRYLSVTRRFPAVVPPVQWLHDYAEKLEELPKDCRADTLEDALISLRALYQDVAKTPALQGVIAPLVRWAGTALEEPTEQTARLTVLIVYLQNGMSLPLFTANHPTVVRVMKEEARYAPEVRRALAMMPTPKAAPAEERRGRFVLKRLESSKVTPPAALPLLDLNLTDPFADASLRFEPAAPDPSSQQSTEAPAAPPAPPSSETAKSAAALPEMPAAEEALEIPSTENASMTAEDPAQAAPPAKEEKPLSYYAKFFSSSVGQILTGRGDHHVNEEKPKCDTPAPSPEPAQTDVAPPVEELKPRRTRLHPSLHTTPEEPAPIPQPPPAPPTAPTAVPVTSFTTNWGVSASSSPSSPLPSAAPAPTPQPTANRWRFSPASPAAASPEQCHSAAFSSLFGGNHHSQPSAEFSPCTPDPVASSPSVTQPTRVSGSMGGNVYFNPSTRSTTSPGRPAMSRRVVMTRSAGPGAAPAAGTVPGQARPATTVAATPTFRASYSTAMTSSAAAPTMMASEQDNVRGIYTDTSRSTSVPSIAGNRGRPQVVVNAATASPHSTAAAAPPHGTNGIANFMHETGVSKIPGYNMDGAQDGPATSAPPSSPTPPTTRSGLDWMDAARRVARVTRLPRSKIKTRTQTNLSAWLNTPTARLHKPGKGEEADPPESPPAAAATGGLAESTRGRQTTVAEVVMRRRSKKERVRTGATPELAGEAEASGTASSGKRSGGRSRGRAEKTATAASTVKTPKGGKATPATAHGKNASAQAKKKAGKAANLPASTSKKSATVKTSKATGGGGAAGNGGRAKRATPAAKPTTKKAAKPVVKKSPVAAKKKPAANAKGRKK